MKDYSNIKLLINLAKYGRFIIISGQGSQIVGMGSEFYNNFDIVKKFSTADEKLNYPLSEIILKYRE